MTDAERADLRRLMTERIETAAAEGAADAARREDITLDQQSVGRLSRMDAIQRREMARATSARRDADLRRLRAALDRLDDPEFGRCAECGEEIGLARLRVDPALMRCAECTRSA